jgi:hypothetical protein
MLLEVLPIPTSLIQSPEQYLLLAEQPGGQFLEHAGIFLFTTMFRAMLG